MGSIFKAYDIRGVYGRDLDEATAEAIGRAFVTFLKCRKVVVGQDMRPHSAPLFAALARGITRQGADVVHLGLCSTPMAYNAINFLNADAGVMITASHNPGEWNGFKLCRDRAIPISGQTGIKDIEKIALSGGFAAAAAVPGKISRFDIEKEYVRHVGALFAMRKPIRAVADYANAMGICEAAAIKPMVALDPLFDTLDGTFPNHEANPLKTGTLRALQARVLSGGYDFGVAFDGDADRAGFVDEKGAVIPMDMITALIARDILKRGKGKILYDLRSSRAVKEVVQECGGQPMMCRVGHAFIKQQMRAEDALFAGELSGHYYFRDNYFTESSAMATLSIASLLSAGGKPLSELIRPLCRYAKSEEINSEVPDADAVFKRLREAYRNGRMFELDGLSVEFPDWWFNVRSSNTEPLVRLNLEASSPGQLEARQKEILGIIRKS